MTKKLCYILPEYNTQTEQHFYHLYEFLQKLSKKLDIFLIVEKKYGETNLSYIQRIYVQKFKFYPLRFIELLIVTFFVRLMGYNRFYTHYSFFGGICSAIVSKFSKGKSYYWYCALTKNMFDDRKPSIGLYWAKFTAIFPVFLILKMITFLVTGTNYVKTYFCHHFNIHKNKVKIMPNWVNLERFNKKLDRKALLEKLEISQNQIILSYIHRLSKRKGIHHIIPIAKQLKEELDNFIILVIGDGPHKNKLKELIKLNNLDRFFRVLGNVPNKIIWKYYKISDVYLMPSDLEGFPRVLIEAMAAGTPFVATQVGGVRDIITKQQSLYIVEPKNPYLFAKKIIDLINNPHQRKILARTGLEHVEKYSLKNVIEIFNKMI